MYGQYGRDKGDGWRPRDEVTLASVFLIFRLCAVRWSVSSRLRHATSRRQH